MENLHKWICAKNKRNNVDNNNFHTFHLRYFSHLYFSSASLEDGIAMIKIDMTPGDTACLSENRKTSSSQNLPTPFKFECAISHCSEGVSREEHVSLSPFKRPMRALGEWQIIQTLDEEMQHVNIAMFREWSPASLPKKKSQPRCLQWGFRIVSG